MKTYYPHHYKLQIRFYNQDFSFGKGVVQLLEGIEQYGSLKQSYQAMGMSQAKAWKILNKAEQDLSVKLVERMAGGSHGGSSSLTKEAKELIVRYHLMMNDIENATEEAFRRYFVEDNI